MRWHDIEVVLDSIVITKRPIVVLDLDDVVFDTMQAIVNYVNKTYGKNYSINEARRWSIAYAPWVKDGTVPFHEAVQIFRKVAKAMIPLRKGAQEGIFYMQEQGAQVMFLTKRTIYIEEAAKKNLALYGLDDFPFVNAPFERGGKERVLRRLYMKGARIVMFVDDSPHNLEETHRMGFPVVRWDMPYNKMAPCDFSVSSWRELIILFEYLMNKYHRLFFA
jgi:predicted secreted acid phosphatase